MTEGLDVTDEQQPTAAGGRIEVIGGGTPSAAELAALTVALTPTGGGGAEDTRAPAWARAGLLENVGHRRPQRPSDLDATFRLG